MSPPWLRKNPQKTSSAFFVSLSIVIKSTVLEAKLSMSSHTFCPCLHSDMSLEFGKEKTNSRSVFQHGIQVSDNMKTQAVRGEILEFGKANPGTVFVFLAPLGPTGIGWSDSESEVLWSGPAILKHLLLIGNESEAAVETKPALPCLPDRKCNRILATQAGQINTPWEVSPNATVVRHKSCHYHWFPGCFFFFPSKLTRKRIPAERTTPLVIGRASLVTFPKNFQRVCGLWWFIVL